MFFFLQFCMFILYSVNFGQQSSHFLGKSAICSFVAALLYMFVFPFGVGRVEERAVWISLY